MTKSQATLILLTTLLLLTPSLADKGDEYPYCLFPYQFHYPTTMSVDPNPIDLQQYTTGSWYEITRMPAIFEDQCACSQADYTIDQSGKFVHVDNSCTTTEGRTDHSLGKAYSMNGDNTKLNVFFNPVIGGAYWVLERDLEYKWVMVGEPCRQYLWILSREKSIDGDVFQRLVGKAKEIGYDTSKLIMRGDC